MIVIRPAQLEHIPQILDIERACFSRPWSERSMMFELESADAVMLVAEEDGDVLGFSVLHRFCSDGELFNIAVKETRRREGIGGRLLKRTLEEARGMEIKQVYLEVRKSNSEARALYAKYGFTVCGERKNYYDDPKEDAILMDAEI